MVSHISHPLKSFNTFYTQLLAPPVYPVLYPVLFSHINQTGKLTKLSKSPPVRSVRPVCALILPCFCCCCCCCSDRCCPAMPRPLCTPHSRFLLRRRAANEKFLFNFDHRMGAVEGGGDQQRRQLIKNHYKVKF